MQFIKIDRPLELINIHKTDGTRWTANSPAPLRVCWVYYGPVDAFNVGDILAVMVEEDKPLKEHVVTGSYAGKLHTVVTVYYVADSRKADSSDVIALSDFLATVKRAGAGKGGYTGTPRKPEYGEGERMQARTITLTPTHWAKIEAMPGKNLSDKVRGMVEAADSVLLGNLPT